MVPRYNGFHGPAFPVTRGTMQGGKLFNVVVGNFIITWMSMTVEDQRVSHDGMGETVGRCLGVFYDNDSMVGSCDSDWIQHAMNVLVGLFRRYGLAANVAKSCAMTCQPGALWAGMLEEAMVRKCTGLGDLYRVRFRTQVPCLECGVGLTAGSMTAHCRCMHGTKPAINWSWLPFSKTVHQPQVYDVRFPQSTKR